MSKLHGYIGKELVKVTSLALLAFTLVMTIFAIIEPLRKYGLEAGKALGLIVFTLPMMMSLTLPIAALFAATIVYGRFSQDNELLACRASGISTLNILTPALILGGAVTVASLLLSSFVTPQIAKTVEMAVKANVRSIAYQELRRKSGVRWQNKGWVVHADRVDEKEDKIEGLVVARPRGKNYEEIELLVAPKALMRFTERAGDTWVTFYLVDAAVASTRTGQYSVAETSVPPYTVKIPSLAREDPSWYDWPKLVRTLGNPIESKEVQSVLNDIQLVLCYDMLAREISSAIQSGKSYSELSDHDGRNRYHIRAGSAEISSEGVVTLASGETAAGRVPVEISVLRDGRLYQVISAETGTIEAKMSEVSMTSFVSIDLPDGADVRTISEGRMPPQRRQNWRMGQLPIPEYLVQKANTIGLDDVCTQARQLTRDESIIKKIANLKDSMIGRLTKKIKAEMHMRAAYSLSCLLMVAMGAALGLMLRGGQVASAFAISVVPASVVIVMMMMGKQMARNDALPIVWGLLTIWLGVLGLLAANGMIYLHLSRK